MKKNVILLVIDSLSADEMEDDRYGASAMPFIQSLKKKSIYVRNFYSEGPHTEAGVRGLLCGIDGLDDNGYMNQYNETPKMIFDHYLDAGYDAYSFTFATNNYPERIRDKVMHYYTQASEFELFIYWRLSYFKRLYEKNELNDIDICDLIGCYRNAFNGYLGFLDREKNRERSYDMIKERILPLDFKSRYQEIMEECREFEKDPRSYVIKELETGGKKILKGRICDPEFEVDRDKLTKVEGRYKKFLRKVKRKQVVNAVFDKRTDPVKVVKSIIARYIGGDQTYAQGLLARIKLANDFDISKMIRTDNDGSSLKTQFSFMVDRLKERDREKPYMVYFHTISQHNKTEWFSFDENEAVIGEEIEAAIELFQNTKGYHGNFAYRFGLRYVDQCIKDFIERMGSLGMMKDTIIAITADHGSSVTSKPIRDTPFFNNCHSELYHIPLIIYGEGIDPVELDGFYENKDLLPTLLDLCEIKYEDTLRGKDILDTSYIPKSAHSERIGSGCPSLQHRHIYFVSRNERYSIEYKVKLFQKFDEGTLTEVYDRILDEEERKNIADKIDKRLIEDLLDAIKDRHEKLQKNYIDWLEKRKCIENL